MNWKFLFGTTVLSVLVSVVLTTRDANALSYQLIDLGTLGASQSYGTSVNNSGQVVGYLHPTTGGNPSGAFIWDKGVMTSLGINAQAQAINDHGQVAVGSYLWSNGTTQHLGTLGDTSHGAISTESFGLNNAGTVVGASYVTASSYHAFSWSNGVMQDLGTLGGSNSIAFDINEQGQVIGRYDTGSGAFHATLWDTGVTSDLGTLGGTNSIGMGINDHGQIAGHAQIANGDYHAFFWDGGVMTDIGTLGGSASSAAAINNRGQIVGTTQFSNGEYGAYLWDQSTGMTDLCWLTDCRNQGWELLYAANDISDSGRITGFGWINNELHAFMIAVPEPPTIALFAVGFLGLFWRAVRRTQ